MHKLKSFFCPFLLAAVNEAKAIKRRHYTINGPNVFGQGGGRGYCIPFADSI